MNVLSATYNCNSSLLFFGLFSWNSILITLIALNTQYDYCFLLLVITSILWSFGAIKEIIKEVRFLLSLCFFQSWKTHILINVSSMHRSNIIKDVWTPDINLLNIIESFVTCSHEIVNLLWISHSVILSVVCCELQLCLLWGCVLWERLPWDY